MPFLLVLIALLVSSCDSSRATFPAPPAPRGDSFNNGGGISEQNLVYAHRQLPRLLVQCRKGCGLSSAEASLAARIVPAPLLFLSSRAAPEKFAAPHQRVGAWVAALPQPGSPLFIDGDALYPDTPQGPRSIDAREAAESLVEALGLQAGATTRLAHSLAEKVGRLFSSRAERLSLAALGQPDLGAWVLGGDDTEDVSLVDTVEWYPIGERLRGGAPCPDGTAHVQQWHLRNVHWATDRDPLELRADVSYRCESAALSGTLVVRVPVARGKVWRMQPARVTWQYGDLERGEAAPWR